MKNSKTLTQTMVTERINKLKPGNKEDLAVPAVNSLSLSGGSKETLFYYYLIELNEGFLALRRSKNSKVKSADDIQGFVRYCQKIRTLLQKDTAETGLLGNPNKMFALNTILDGEAVCQHK
jgi:hypothetical protein